MASRENRNISHDTLNGYFSFDEETQRLVNELGYVPQGCYCTTETKVFIPEHAGKNKEIVQREIEKLRREILEAENRLLQKALDDGQMIFRLSDN